ncbi:hypothetical protein M3Y97_00083900 [Aphelenchoides bicaudatus]|nr:hypothetical protein M3Y97_00083900 [Aphelenchoides bicaudatus]
MFSQRYVVFALVFACLLNAEDCVDKFCPPGTYCEAKFIVKCSKPPCKPLFLCLPVSQNGCASMECSHGLVCVEKTIPCISQSCKKVGICARPNTCEAEECPPSHKCKIENGTPKCVRGIFTLQDVIAQLPQRQTNEPE